MRTVVAFAGIVLVFLLGAAPAGAASGDIVRTLHPAVCPSGNYGLTTKGKTLLTTCPVGPGQTPTIYELRSKNGKVAATHQVTGLAAGMTMFAIAYDAATQRIWVCTWDQIHPAFQLGTVNPLTNAYSAVANTADCTGGLEYDASRRLWSTPFGGTAVTQVDPTTGGTVRTIPLAGLGACGTSGIAIEGGSAFVSTEGFDATGQFDCGILSAPIKTGTTSVFVPAGVGAVADLACDSKTFSATHTTVIWAADAASSTLVAREAPGSGGAIAPKCK